MMTKKIAIISLVLAVALAGLYSAFWFIYADQTTTRLNNLVHENSDHISVGDVQVTGFPFKQSIKIYNLKLKIPNPALDQYQIIVKELEATSELFDEDIELTSMGQVFINDAKGNSFGYVEFNKIPEVEITLDDHVVEEFYYEDYGYRILDEDKVALYIAESTEILYEGEIEDDGKIKAKLQLEVKDIQGFDVSNIYETLIEDKVAANAKSGKITIKKSSDPLNLAPVIEEVETKIDDVLAIGQEVISEKIEQLPELELEDLEIVKSDEDEEELEEDIVESAEDLLEIEQRQINLAKKQDLIRKLEVEKGNLEIELEYELKPNYEESKGSAAIGSFGRKVAHFDRMINIKKFEYNNSIYSIYVNGRINVMQGDELPSGAISVNVEGLDDLVGHLSLNFEDIIAQKVIAPEIEYLELPNPDLLMAEEDIIQVVEIDPAQVKEVAQEIVIESDEAVLEPVMHKEVIQKIEAQAVAKEIVIESDEAIVQPIVNQENKEDDNKVKDPCSNPIIKTEAENDKDNEMVLEMDVIVGCADPVPGQDTEKLLEIEKKTQETDPYKAFLKNLVEDLPELSQEISAKNQLSEGQSAVFDLRREKNDATILINETLMSEIFVKAD